MHGIRTTKTKAFISIAALDMFLEDFDAAPMIQALVDICEWAMEQPGFGEGDNPGFDEYQWADEATTALHILFNEENCVEEDSYNCPRFEVDSKRGVIILTHYVARAKKAKRKSVPPPPSNLDKIPLILWKRLGSQN